MNANKPVDKTSSRNRQSRQHRRQWLVVGAIALSVFLLSGLYVNSRVFQNSADLRQRAAATEPTMYLSPAVGDYSAPGKTNVRVQLDTAGRRVTAVEVKLNFSNQSVVVPGTVTPGTSFPVVLQKPQTVLTKMVDGSGNMSFVVGVPFPQPGEQVGKTGIVDIATIELKLLKAGQITLNLNSSQAAAIGSDANIITRYVPWNFTISGSTLPTPTGSPTLQVSFLQQGVTKAGVSKPVEVGLKYYPVLTDPGMYTNRPATVKKIQTTATSGADGVFRLVEPISLAYFGLTTNQSVEVYLKTLTSLRSHWGEFRYTGAPISLVNTTMKLRTGDYYRTGDASFNVLTIHDIAKPIPFYTSLKAPVTPESVEYDADADGFITIYDIAIPISNYTDLRVPGDSL